MFESGKVKNVLVYKIDSLKRSTKNLIELVELFNQHHCAFNSLMEAIDSSSATGQMFLKIFGIFESAAGVNVREFAGFKDTVECAVYFRHPFSSLEKGTNMVV
ncbi:MAG: recombinase family protein [Clostridiales bacterium]|jgi:DNA invertase Pin-like site-specific DNA recombinase|nr:recombinase family protein [Clostridiales bacterium]